VPRRLIIPAEAAAPRRIVPGPVRLDFLDGIRGLAALYVVIHHVAQIYLGEKSNPPAAYYWFVPLMQLGHFAVAIFIVLSGFCLMLPVAQSLDGRLRDGFVRYFWRRIRRIVPAFYAAILMSLLLVAFVPSMRRHDGEFWNFAFGGANWHTYFDWKAITSHLLVLHALSPNWINRIDPPMWSIGVEWLNYFLMPALLIPVWRKAGSAALVIFAIGLSFLPYASKPIFHHDHYTMHWAQPWFLALFAMGMAGAAMMFPRATLDRSRKLDELLLRLALHPLTLPLIGVAIYFCRHNRVAVDFLVAAVTLCVIFHSARATTLGRHLCKTLESRFAVWLGAISYSLYLFHGPLLMLLQRLIEPLHLSPALRLAAMLVLGMPMALIAGVLGYRFFERPFLGRARRFAAASPGPCPASAVPTAPLSS
jgi:peptidoglycan/LPS O-acetylase OafA/YrhL